MRFWFSRFLGLILTVTSITGYTADITVQGWSHPLTLGSITNAGEYYPSTLENELPTDASANITGLAADTDAWTLMASTTMTGINIEVQCSSSGTGNGTISGCNNYTTLTSSEQEIFRGTGNRSSIPLKFKITNFDVTDGSGTKDIQIQYKVVVTP